MKNASATVLFFIALLITACQAKIDGGSGGPPGAVKQEAPAGPNLEGLWKSDCIADPMVNGWHRRVSLNVKGAAAEHVITRYSEKNCQGQVTPETLKGNISYKPSSSKEGFLLELNIPIDSNVSTSRFFIVSLSGEKLQISDTFAWIDDAPSVKATITLNKVTGEGATAKPKSAVTRLEGGGYTQKSGIGKFCAQSVSTMDVNNVTQTVYVELLSPCAGYRLTLECKGLVCENSQYLLTILDEKSYRFQLKRDAEDNGVFSK